MEKFQTTKTYKEVQELFENQLKNADATDKDESIAVMLFGVLRSFTPTTIFILKNLTGIELDTKEQLYNYLSKNVTFTEEEIGQLAAVQFSESLANEGKSIEDILDILKDTISA